MPRVSPDRQRLFVALWPEPQTRQQIAVTQQQVQVRTGLIEGGVGYDNLHMTLCFLGEVSVADIESLKAALDSVTVPTFTMQLDRWGQFPKPGILWLGPASPPEELLLLHRRICRACAGVIAIGKQKHYRPHVTLFRKVMQLQQIEAGVAIDWPVDRIVLVRSETLAQGVRYRVIHEVVAG